MQAMWVFVRLPHAADVSCVSHSELPTGIEVAKAITGVQVCKYMSVVDLFVLSVVLCQSSSYL